MSIEVYIDWKGESLFVGKLHTSERTPATSFEYSSEWLARPNAFPIDPTSLPLRAGPHHASMLFGAFADCGPDRWGRLLIKRSASKGILERMPRHELDYALALDDASRIGALRFRAEGGGPFLGVSSGKLPPIVHLTALLNAANAVHGESETAEDLRFLLGRGSPLGGARPKSCVTLRDCSLAIAKFPKPDDILDVAAGEVLALTLAGKAGMNVAEHQLLSVDGKSISVINRFDRQGEHRIPFLSANTLLSLPQDDPGGGGFWEVGGKPLGDHPRAEDAPAEFFVCFVYHRVGIETRSLLFLFNEREGAEVDWLGGIQADREFFKLPADSPTERHFNGFPLA